LICFCFVCLAIDNIQQQEKRNSRHQLSSKEPSPMKTGANDITVVCRWKATKNNKEMWMKRQSFISLTSIEELQCWKFMLGNKSLWRNMSSPILNESEIEFDNDFDVIKITYNNSLNSEDEVDEWWTAILHVLETKAILVKMYVCQYSCGSSNQDIQPLLDSTLVKSGIVSIDIEIIDDKLLLIGCLEHISKILRDHTSFFESHEVFDKDGRNITCQELTLHEHQTSHMQKFGCTKILMERYTDVWLSTNDTLCVVYMSGPVEDLRKITVLLKSVDWLAQLVCCQEIGLEEMHLNLFINSESRSYVDNKLLSVKNGAFVLDMKEKLFVFGENANVTLDVETKVKQCFDHHCMYVQNPRRWKVEAQKLTEKNKGKFIANFPPSKGHEITFFATDDVFRESDFTSLICQMSMDAHNEDQVLVFSNDEFNLLKCDDAFTKIESYSNSLDVYLHSVTFGDRTYVLMRGPETGIDKTKSKVTGIYKHVVVQFHNHIFNCT